MKNLCKSCSKNMDGVCEVFQIVLEEVITDCYEYDLLVGDFSMEEHIGYDMGLCPVWGGLRKRKKTEQNEKG